jgi:hypothetical protein
VSFTAMTSLTMSREARAAARGRTLRPKVEPGAATAAKGLELPPLPLSPPPPLPFPPPPPRDEERSATSCARPSASPWPRRGWTAVRILEDAAAADDEGSDADAAADEESTPATAPAASSAAEATAPASSPATSTVIGCGLEEAAGEEPEPEPEPAADSSREAAMTAESVEGLSLPDECSARTRAPEQEAEVCFALRVCGREGERETERGRKRVSASRRRRALSTFFVPCRHPSMHLFVKPSSSLSAAKAASFPRISLRETELLRVDASNA